MKDWRLMLAAAAMAGSMGAAEAANIYGSIAFSQETGVFGYSFNWPSKSAAQRRALKYCKPRAWDCKIVVNFYNACGALAVGDGNGYGVGWAETRRQAERTAMANCRAYTSDCYIKQSVCSGQ